MIRHEPWQETMHIAAKFAFAALMALATLAGHAASAAAAELIMFDDPSCVWCRRWTAEIGPGYPRSPEGQIAPLRRVQMRDQANAGVVLTSPVRGTPTFVLAEGGREVGRIPGYPGSDNFYPLLAELLQRLPAPPAEDRKPALRSTSSGSDTCARC